ncbi:unnamed protein product [Clonostachys rosea]|uniref:Fungal N-terminal domain-containing protein n=1 Tax=Bionectria ochroleuca TaxID=29856 RepID=A0ABY6TP12_BIOOC|nr:unnamed protein product [Clonostachys rosea]
MADPLSIAASIIGIAAAAAKVGGFLSAFISSTADAPSSAASALASVEDMKMTLSAIQPLMDSLHAVPSSRKGLIQLDHLSVIITHSVLTISELESIVCYEDGLMHRLRWAWNEKRVLGLLPRLDSQKCSLALMVSILQSESDANARECQNKLLLKVDEILKQNEALVERLQLLGGPFNAGVPSVKFMDDSASFMSHSRMSIQSVRSVASLTLSTARRQSTVAISRFSVASRRSFEVALAKSRVYTRATSEEDMSYTSSKAPTNAWSMLSGLSLNDISVVSAFRLPLNLDDIDSFAPGSTFSTLLTQELAAHEVVQPEPVSIRRDMNTETDDATPEQSQNSEQQAIIPTTIPLSAKGPMKIVLIGNKNSLKSEMLHAYLNPKETSETRYVPRGHNTFNAIASFNRKHYNISLQDTTGQEKYRSLRQLIYANTDVFLILSNEEYDTDLKSVRELWLPEVSHYCPNTPCIVVRTGKRKHSSAPSSPVAGNEQRNRSSSSVDYDSRTFKQMFCDVGDPKNVRIVFGQAILAASKDQEHHTNLKSFLESWQQTRTVASASASQLFK